MFDMILSRAFALPRGIAGHVARSADFRFLVPMTSLGVIAKAGTPIARDGDHVWRAPHDDTVLVMPSMNHVRAGNTQARLGRFVDDQPD